MMEESIAMQAVAEAARTTMLRPGSMEAVYAVVVSTNLSFDSLFALLQDLCLHRLPATKNRNDQINNNRNYY